MFSRSHHFKFGLRVTAAVLLAVIGWGSTVELTHGHSAAGTNLNAQPLVNCGQTAATDIAASTSIQESAPARSSSRSNSSSECLICQLHHNLATTLLSEPACLDPLHQQAARSLATAPVHLLEFATAQPGRAPPTIL